tara:strand:+ start:881 stop:1774 length:894 start_codon:yes stop_codon:yes gene_type:complete
MAYLKLYTAVILGCFLGYASVGSAAETHSVKRPGLDRIQLVTDVQAITPGKTLTMGLILDPAEGFHTYWRGPGIVGVATTFEWTLPEGFSAGDVIWPPPEQTDMAGINAHGYRSETCLLIPIQIPEVIDTDTVTIAVKCAWMACANTCHPGIQEFSIELPVNKSGGPQKFDKDYRAKFKSIRSSVPPPAPKSWKISARLVTPETIKLKVAIPKLDNTKLEGIYFFCDDMQVDSDAPQQVSLKRKDNDTLSLLLTRPDFAPKGPKDLSGVLYRPEGWPGLDSKWLEITAHWPTDTFQK